MKNKSPLLDELSNSISFMFGIAYKQFRTLANKTLIEEFDITVEMLLVLRVLTYLGKVPQQTLSEAIRRERSVTKRLVDNCIKRDLICVYKSDENKKARYLLLTDTGCELERNASRAYEKLAESYYKPLTPDERQMLIHLCSKLLKDDVYLDNY